MRPGRGQTSSILDLPDGLHFRAVGIAAFFKTAILAQGAPTTPRVSLDQRDVDPGLRRPDGGIQGPDPAPAPRTSGFGLWPTAAPHPCIQRRVAPIAALR